MIQQSIQPNKGFSLVEVLVAITLLLVVIVGPMQLLKQTSNSTLYASEQVVAYYLAQEGLELVHKQRDDLLLEYFDELFEGSTSFSPMAEMSDNTANGVLNECYLEDGCGVSIDNSGQLSVTSCSGDSCRLYLHDTGRSQYRHGSGSGSVQSPYSRRITIEPLPNSTSIDEFKVTSIVEWRTGSLVGGQRVQLVTYLQNVYGTN